MCARPHSHLRHDSFTSVTAHCMWSVYVNESCHRCECVMSHMWRKCKRRFVWVASHAHQSYNSCELNELMWMNHVTDVSASCYACEGGARDASCEWRRMHTNHITHVDEVIWMNHVADVSASCHTCAGSARDASCEWRRMHTNHYSPLHVECHWIPISNLNLLGLFSTELAKRDLENSMIDRDLRIKREHSKCNNRRCMIGVHATPFTRQVWCTSITCVTWLTHICDMIHSNDCIHMSCMIRVHATPLRRRVSCTSITCVTWRTHFCDMIHSHDFIHMSCMIGVHATPLTRSLSCTPITHLYRSSSFLGLFYHVPLKRDQDQSSSLLHFECSWWDVRKGAISNEFEHICESTHSKCLVLRVCLFYRALLPRSVEKWPRLIIFSPSLRVQERLRVSSVACTPII